MRRLLKITAAALVFLAIFFFLVKWPVHTLTTLVAAVIALGLYDLLQTKHTVLRNYPVMGHLRYLLESIGP